MIPAVGLVSLIWAMSCFVLGKAALSEPTRCCACTTLQPYDIPKGFQPQKKPSPFKITVEESQYTVNNEIHVSIEATDDQFYRSFIIGAFTYPYKVGALPVGQISLLQGQDATAEEKCEKQDSYLLQGQTSKPNRKLNFVWVASKSYNHIEFRASFVVNNDVYWVSEKSKPVEDPLRTPLPKQKKKTTAPISVVGCGVTKGCFRQPPDCMEAHCLYILTWKSVGNIMTFELGGLADGSSNRYVAFGLSDDTYMGDDTVFTCAHDIDETEVHLSYNADGPKENVPIPKYSDPDKTIIKENYPITFEEASYQNGRLRCRFDVRRNLRTYNNKLSSLSAGPFHLLFAHGFADEGRPQQHSLSVEDFPLASADKIDLYSLKVNAHGRARYPLAKAHGCLMILAWIFFASLGIIMTKYYKPMWPNKSMFGQKYWFLAHYNCMAMMFIISIIGIILIFVEAGGYSEAPDLPQKAHPILGIIILVCIVINPVIALLRPRKDNDCRPVFNWFHWAFGTIAHVLAIPQMFIGMDFGKVMVPWYATWIVVIWVIFHIAVELTLEIHQCCTYKKNKERRKKHEQLKREYPKQHHPEPEPAGRRFKRFMLFLYIAVTAIITLIMIIIIAVV